MGMVKAATHRVRFRLFDLTASSRQGVPQFPVNCWRATFILNGEAGQSVVDGASFGTLIDIAGTGTGNPVSFTVGGVFMPDGSPAILDQRALLQRANRFYGIIVCEYLEPL